MNGACHVLMGSGFGNPVLYPLVEDVLKVGTSIGSQFDVGERAEIGLELPPTGRHPKGFGRNP